MIPTKEETIEGVSPFFSAVNPREKWAAYYKVKGEIESLPKWAQKTPARDEPWLVWLKTLFWKEIPEEERASIEDIILSYLLSPMRYDNALAVVGYAKYSGNDFPMLAFLSRSTGRDDNSENEKWGNFHRLLSSHKRGYEALLVRDIEPLWFLVWRKAYNSIALTPQSGANARNDVLPVSWLWLLRAYALLSSLESQTEIIPWDENASLAYLDDSSIPEKARALMVLAGRYNGISTAIVDKMQKLLSLLSKDDFSIFAKMNIDEPRFFYGSAEPLGWYALGKMGENNDVARHGLNWLVSQRQNGGDVYGLDNYESWFALGAMASGWGDEVLQMLGEPPEIGYSISGIRSLPEGDANKLLPIIQDKWEIGCEICSDEEKEKDRTHSKIDKLINLVRLGLQSTKAVDLILYDDSISEKYQYSDDFAEEMMDVVQSYFRVSPFLYENAINAAYDIFGQIDALFLHIRRDKPYAGGSTTLIGALASRLTYLPVVMASAVVYADDDESLHSAAESIVRGIAHSPLLAVAVMLYWWRHDADYASRIQEAVRNILKSIVPANGEIALWKQIANSSSLSDVLTAANKEALIYAIMWSDGDTIKRLFGEAYKKAWRDENAIARRYEGIEFAWGFGTLERLMKLAAMYEL